MTSRTTAGECRTAAAEYLKQAKRTADPVRKSEYQVLAKKWMKLAEKLANQPPLTRSNVLLFRPPQNRAPKGLIFRLRPPRLSP
jgi:hypothetical protein